MKNKWDEIFEKRKAASLPTLISYIKEKKFSKKFEIFNIVGTNGKGSVSNYLAQGLESAKAKVGLFTSPHLISATERISINGINITEKEFFVYYNKIKDDVEEYGFNFFQILYIIAINYFNNKNCDFVVMEAGIGGTLDTTNAINGEYGAVTSIGKDHTEILGNTLEEIAIDKSGIINKNMVFFIPSLVKQKKHFQKSKKFHIINVPKTDYETSNKIFAKEILKIAFDIEFDDFKTPFGRTTFLKNNNFIAILDVGHNLHGIKESLKKIDANDFDQVVLTMNKTKDKRGVLKLFKNKKVFIYQKNIDFRHASDFGLSKNHEIIDLELFWNNQDKNTLYIGSFYLIGEIYEIIKRKASKPI